MKKIIVFILFCYGYFGLYAQNVLLDRPVLAATLTVFPDMNNQNQYYFLPNKLRLGIGEGGKPQFSFLRFVQNVRTEEGGETKREGDGGGVVHAVVELYVTDEQKKDAERELRRLTKNGEATIMGPIIYKSGTMSLISSIANEKGGYAKSVIGLGPAPLLVGNKAAVSVLLTKDGAKILWESFKTSAPDMSFSFVMSVAGYRSPINAKIEVDYEKIYQSESISLGLKYQSKSVSNSGSRSNGSNQGQQSQGTQSGGNGQEKTQQGGQSAGDRSQAQPTQQRPQPQTEARPAQPTQGGEQRQEPPAAPKVRPSSDVTPSATKTGGQGSLDAFFEFDPKWQVIIDNFDAMIAEEQAALADESKFYLDAELRLAFEEMRQKGEIKVTGATGDANMEKILEIAYSKLIDQMFERVDNGSTSTQDMNSILQAANQRNGEQNNQGNNGQGNNSGGTGTQETDGSKTSLGITFAYQMKKIKKTGRFVCDLNRSMTDELQFRFDENFGKLNCKECFKQVNLDDPLFRQREIQVSVDGLNADQFKKFINFATISLKKTHGNNDITTDEVRVGINDFDKKGNVYRLLYGWKDEKDADKNRWLKYEYKTIWSLFGDYTIEEDWKPSEAFGINVAPPVRPITVDVEASPDLLKAAQVRAVNVKFFYNYGGGEKVEQINIRTEQTVTASKVELLLPQNVYDYEYEILWLLSGNRQIKSGRQKTNNTMLYVDELPK